MCDFYGNWKDGCDELRKKYGWQYLEDSGYSDDIPRAMCELEEVLSTWEPMDAFVAALCAGGWPEYSSNFNRNADFFFFDGYGHLRSLHAFQLDEYYDDVIDEKSFKEWCIDEGLFEEEEEDDEDDEDEE